MLYPDFETVMQLSGDYNMIPVTYEYWADTDTPIRVFQQLQTEKNCFLLESVEGGQTTARYSFVGRNPFAVFKSFGTQIEITENGVTRRISGDPIAALKNLTDRFQTPQLEALPFLTSGAVGFFGYDIVRRSEYLPNTPDDDLKLPEMHFLLVDEMVVFDHRHQKIVIVVNLRTEGDLAHKYQAAKERILQIQSELETYAAKGLFRPDVSAEPELRSNMTKENFCENVRIAKEHIRNGDIFQVVLSQRFEVETQADPLNVYRALRVINPSPYMYYLKFDDYQIAGASPEMLVRVENSRVITGPIAGTRKRGRTPEADAELERSLLADEKENAEHIMLVDLSRNDIGKICRFGSVEVTKLRMIQRFSHVMHMTSEVEGDLRDDQNAYDALCAALPAGTLSGAPKIRAMEIIDELEPQKRGCYGGAIGYISFNGNLDSCITIRTAVFRNKKAYIQAGAGIVYDSDPETEYEETVNKAGAVLKAIREAVSL